MDMDLDDFLRLIYIGNEKLIIITNRKKFTVKYIKMQQILLRCGGFRCSRQPQFYIRNNKNHRQINQKCGGFRCRG